ncbi:MAG: peroxiredoxin [Desulfurococcales archaeon]|nr:peroxiredoxin [Desulfurococcales archaeon]
MVGEGEIAPDFEAIAHTGERVRLSQYRGKIVVLYFYPRAMTSGCTREGIRFNELLDEFERHGVIVLGMSTDPPEKNRKFAEKYGFRFLLLSDPEGEVASLYGVLRETRSGRKSAARTTFIIDRDGRIVKVLKNIRPAEKHADLALEIVKSLSQA